MVGIGAAANGSFQHRQQAGQDSTLAFQVANQGDIRRDVHLHVDTLHQLFEGGAELVGGAVHGVEILANVAEKALLLGEVGHALHLRQSARQGLQS